MTYTLSLDLAMWRVVATEQFSCVAEAAVEVQLGVELRIQRI
jgi:hypothetical protein